MGDRNDTAIQPGWRFGAQPVCGSVLIQRDKFSLVGDSGQSVLHALAHIRLRTLASSGERISRVAARDIEDWLEVENGFWTASQEEQFANLSEQYLARRIAVFRHLAVEPYELPEALLSALAEVFAAGKWPPGLTG